MPGQCLSASRDSVQAAQAGWPSEVGSAPAKEQRFEPHNGRRLSHKVPPGRSWRGRDLNPRPPGYEPGELPDCSTTQPQHNVAERPPLRAFRHRQSRYPRIP